MSVTAEEMQRRRRVPVARPAARPAAQQLALPAPTTPGGTPPTTVVPPSRDTISVDRAGRASVANVRPATPIDGTTVRDVQQVRQAGQTAAAQSAARRARLATGAPATSAALGASPAPAVAPAAPAAPGQPAGPRAARIGEAVGRAARPAVNAAGSAARLGAAPVQTAGAGRVPGLARTAPGQMGGAASLLALTGVGSALGSLATPTEQYAQRTGIEGGSLPRELANRTLGTLSDLGAAIADPLIGAGNRVGQFIENASGGRAPEFLTRQAPTLRSRFADTSAAPQVAPPPAAAAPALPQVTPAQFGETAAGALGAPVGAGDQNGNLGIDTPATRRELGSFTGERTGTRRIAEDGTVPAAANAGGGLNVIPAYTGAAQALGSQPRNEPGFVQPRNNARGTLERIDRTIAALGPLDRRSRRQAVVDLLGQRGRIESGTLDRGSAEQRTAAELGQRTAAAELAAEVDREQIAATSANARRQNTQTITGADGTVYSVEGTTLTPLTTQEGQPVRASTKGDNTIDRLAAELLQSSLESGLVDDPAAAAQQAAAAARALQQNLSQAPPSREQFMAAARQANPGASDAQLEAYYTQNYGQ